MIILHIVSLDTPLFMPLALLRALFADSISAWSGSLQRSERDAPLHHSKLVMYAGAVPAHVIFSRTLK